MGLPVPFPPGLSLINKSIIGASQIELRLAAFPTFPVNLSHGHFIPCNSHLVQNKNNHKDN
jgi:hypothetical protein